MIFKIRIEKARDATGREVRAMFLTLLTENEGLGDINAVAELTPGSPLEKEIDGLIIDMLQQKQENIKATNKKRVAKAKK